MATALEVLFSLHDIETQHAGTPQAGLAMLDAQAFDLVIQNMNFSADTTSGEEGEQLFAQIRQHHPDLPVILLNAWTHLGSAVELVKAGAADYIAKLLTKVNNLLKLSEARRELDQRREREQRDRAQLTSLYELCGAVFGDPASERAIALACQVARSELPVLITGPNGSGKEKIAEIIQANSTVKHGSFVALKLRRDSG